MISLFSSFDIKFFNLIRLVILFFILRMLNFVWKNNKILFFLSSLIKFLEEFISSLKLKRYLKFTIMTILSLIIILFFFNFTSVLSFNFALTSQIRIVLFLALSIWTSFIIFSFFKNFNGIVYHFVPEGTPIYLTWFLFIIEIIRNIIRPITLTVRLVANILAGHLLIILLASLVLSKLFVFPLYVLLNLVELFVALIQSYIFITIISLYFSEIN